ncbi:MAG: DoxX family protein [Deltaproteobacteria bacterium]|nr:DoxX family protein [Deltaproteobacteria bacterium]
MRALVSLLSRQSGLGITVLRVVMGLILFAAGYQKVFGGGFAVGFFRSAGIPLPEIMGPVVSLLELIGGGLLVVGLFTRYLGVLFIPVFVVAAMVTFNPDNIRNFMLPLMMLAGSYTLATNGAGSLGIDGPGRRWE